jgi:hypothetical protein
MSVHRAKFFLNLNRSIIRDIYKYYFLIGLFFVQSNELEMTNETKNLLLCILFHLFSFFLFSTRQKFFLSFFFFSICAFAND